MPNWKELSHAYGSAEDLPGILSALNPDPKASAWGNLWDRVCHQGTTYIASPAVLPFLQSAASSWDAPARVMPLTIAGSIVSAPQSALAGYESTVEALRLLALGTVEANELSRTDRIYVMQAVLALEGDGLWGRVLNHLSDGEFPKLCPVCRVDLFLVIGQYGFFSATEDWVRNPATPTTEIRPQKAESLTGTGNWLYKVCTDSDDSVLGEWVCHLFGFSNCPKCEKPFEVADAITEIEKTTLNL